MDERAEIACAAFVARSQEINDECASWPDGYDDEELEELRDLMAAALAAADAVSSPVPNEAAIRADERRRLAKVMSANLDAVVLDVLEVAGELGGRCKSEHLTNGLVLRGCSPGSAQVAIMSALDRRLIIMHDDWTLEVAAPKPETQE